MWTYNRAQVFPKHEILQMLQEKKDLAQEGAW